MNDFFSNLVDRMQTAQPAIAPRRASRFESAAAELPAEPSRAPLAPHTRPDIESNTSPLASPPASPQAPERVLPASPDSHATVPTTPLDRAPIDEPEREPALEAPATPLFDAPRPVTHVHTHTTIVTPRIGEEPARSEIDPRKHPSSAVPTVPSNDTPVDVSEPPPSPPNVPMVPVIVPVIGRAAASPARETLPLQRPLPENNPTLPVPPRIEVTIGSVEVRAIMSPPPPVGRMLAARESPHSPSLDEYLKTRRRSRA